MKITDRYGDTFNIDPKKLSGVEIGKVMKKTIKGLNRKQSRYFLKTKAEEYGLKMGFFESKKSIRKRIENIIMGTRETLDNVIWPRPEALSCKTCEYGFIYMCMCKENTSKKHCLENDYYLWEERKRKVFWEDEQK